MKALHCFCMHLTASRNPTGRHVNGGDDDDGVDEGWCQLLTLARSCRVDVALVLTLDLSSPSSRGNNSV